MLRHQISYTDGASQLIVGKILYHEGNQLHIEDEDGDLWILNWDQVKGVVIVDADDEE